MVTGVKISEMASTTNKTGVVPTVVGGDNYKLDVSEITNDYLPTFLTIPALELVSDITSPYVDLPITQNVWYQLVYDCYPLKSNANNLFEDLGSGRVRYIGGTPAVMVITSECAMGTISGADSCCHAIWRNMGPVAPLRLSVLNVFLYPVYSARIALQQGDILSNAFINYDTSIDLRVSGITMRGVFESTITAAEIVGAELFENPNMTSTDGFTAGDTVLGVSGGELTITANDANSACTANISGLTVGENYRIEIIAKQGAQGATQTISAISFGLLYEVVNIDTADFESYFIDVIATSTSGTITLAASNAGASNDELVLSYLSVKEYL